MILSVRLPGKVLSELQNKIQYPDQLCAWLTQHLDLFGVPGKDTADLAEVSCSYEVTRIIRHPGDTPYISIAFTVKLPMGIECNTDKLPHCYQRINHGLRELLVDMRFDFVTWPFLSARLAESAVNSLTSYPAEPLPSYLQGMLETYIPLHFPGLTWTKIQNLHAASLLPTSMHGFMDERFSQLLFATRQGTCGVELPDNWEPC